MSFNSIFRSLGNADPPDGDNSTAKITEFPATVLDAFIPGFAVISRFIRDMFGFDISIVVSICFILFALSTSLRFIGAHAYHYFEEYCTSFIYIESDDDIFDYMMEWLSELKISKKSRTLMAKTGRENAYDSLTGGEINAIAETGQLLNFSNWDAKVPPTFQPYFGVHRFWHNGRYFEFDRTQKTTLASSWGGSTLREDEHIKLTCIGRSTQPIKELIKEARDYYLDKEKTCTVVRRPAPKEMRGRGRNVWNRVASRPSRPIETVVLDHDQKDRLLADINEYLHPKTAVWYANRGIPYRRGYLLAGPPGTGKSSLAWAIAGLFGLDIYCISLVDPTLTEEDLGVMFTSLPRRCVVLLEDIDAAGLVKRDEPTETAEPKDKETSDAAKLGAEISKAIKASQEKGTKGKDLQGISLSGLLNAIDGVASHEGRVLLMTTNFPEKLDEALIRPGRIDMKIAFTKATKSQMTELFIRMYSPDAEAATPSKPVPAKKAVTSPTPKNTTIRHRKGLSGHELIAKAAQASVPTPPESPRHSSSEEPSSPEPTELQDIAASFARRLPEQTFTPAEIQGFLLTRKNEPMKALHEVGAWSDQTIEAKEKKDRMKTGQVSKDDEEDKNGGNSGHSKYMGADLDDFCDCEWCREMSDDEANGGGDDDDNNEGSNDDCSSGIIYYSDSDDD